jgi:hypothetical protein
MGPAASFGQLDTSAQKAKTMIGRFSNQMLRSIELKYHRLENKLTHYSERSLQQLQKQEGKLQKKLAKKDSLAASQVFASTREKYTGILQKLKHPAAKLNSSSLNNYLPGLDSLQTTFRFLDKAGTAIPGIPTDKLQQLQAASAQLKRLQAQFQNAADVKQFLKERKQLLKDQLDRFGLGNQLKQVNKQVYYYQQQLNEYRALVNDPEKLAQKALGFVRELPAFKDFMSKNSQLAQLFALPTGYGSTEALQGLQTRTAVQQQLSQQLGTGANARQYLQQQIQQAQGELNQLKDKVNQLGGGGSDMAMPEFKPNSQRTKSFWKRMEYGLNIQSQQTHALLPATSDIALTAGYKLNDKSTIGVGAGYKLGWGKNINHMSLTNQGASLRSYLDIKLKGSIWISGGYEEHYQQAFTEIAQLKQASAWQQSGLVGLSKKNGNLQLLWDFLSYSQTPRTTALKFRIGYSF